MTLTELIDMQRAALDGLTAERAPHEQAIRACRALLTDDATLETIDMVEKRVAVAREALAAVDVQIAAQRAKVGELELVAVREAVIDADQATPPSRTPVSFLAGRSQAVQVGREPRTYAAEREHGFGRRGIRPGAMFERDIIAAHIGDFEARERLMRHMVEERTERGDALVRDGQEEFRAVGTSAFGGLVVPQYITDAYAPATAARRPFADAIRQHVLPADGMSVVISRVTTASSVALQASENTAVSETNVDDTLLTIGVQTNAGQQTISRQAIERGTGVEPIVLDDLFRRYATTLNSTLINQATTGLLASGVSITYTDASPTAAELHPKILEGLAGVEAALLDQASGDNIALMHSRRWYWLQSQVGATFPFVAQPGIVGQQGGANLGVPYSSGQRGVLPNGTAVIVDNSVPTNLGVGVNEDRIVLLDRNECHLWEDPSAPMFIRAENTAAGSLGVLLVVYGYFAYTHSRYVHAQVISGTGLVTPTF